MGDFEIFLIFLLAIAFCSSTFSNWRGARRLLTARLLWVIWYTFHSAVYVYKVAKVYITNAVLSIALRIASVGPWMGRYVIDRGFSIEKLFQHRIDLHDSMKTFRGNIQNTVFSSDHELHSGMSRQDTLRETVRIHDDIKREHQTGNFIVSVAVAFTSLIVSQLFEPWGPILGISGFIAYFSIIYPIAAYIRSSLTDAVLYRPSLVNTDEDHGGGKVEVSPNLPAREVTVFWYGWNKMVNQNQKIIHRILLAGLLHGEFPDGYEVGRNLTKRVATEDIELSEAFEEAYKEKMPEEFHEGSMAFWIFKKFSPLQ